VQEVILDYSEMVSWDRGINTIGPSIVRHPSTIHFCISIKFSPRDVHMVANIPYLGHFTTRDIPVPCWSYK
jgi:hypothetical protein